MFERVAEPRPCPTSASWPAAIALALVALGLGHAPAADAQQPQASPAEQTLARELFHAGVAAGEAGRWDEARRAFARAYALDPDPLILINLAAAEVSTGHLVAGADAYRRFLRGAADARAAPYRRAAEQALGEVERRMPRARLLIEGLRRTDVVELDARPVPRAALGLPFPVDPGTHVLRVQRAGTEVARARFEAAERERVGVSLDVGRLPTVEDTSGDQGSEGLHDARTSPSLLESPWLWVGVGAVAVVTVLVIVLAAGGSGNDPTFGTFPPGRFVLP